MLCVVDQSCILSSLSLLLLLLSSLIHLPYSLGYFQRVTLYQWARAGVFLVFFTLPRMSTGTLSSTLEKASPSCLRADGDFIDYPT